MKWDPLAPQQDDLASFILDQCREQELVNFIDAAIEELPALTRDPIFDGYASEEREKIYAQLEALYRALFEYRPELIYTIDPQDRFAGEMRQFVRTVPECIKQREADCIDIVVLFASLLLKIGLNPLVTVVGPSSSRVPTHAILGYWLENRIFSDVKVQWSAVKPHIERIAFLETTGTLRGNKKPFPDASAEALQSLPQDVRNRIPLPLSAQGKISLLPPAKEDAKVFYVVDVRKALQNVSSLKPVIAILGAKGGVGKTSIAARIAELIAETGKNVLIIDFDLSHAGSTHFHSNRLDFTLPRVKTVYDHLLPHSKSDELSKEAFDERLWCVTPPYLVATNFFRPLQGVAKWGRAPHPLPTSG